jgi:hypothetical protein
MDAKQSSLGLLRYWDLSGEDSDTFASSVNIRHHRHHYHITTATMAKHHRDYHRKGNPATRSPYSLIASCILHVRAILAPNSTPHNIHLLFLRCFVMFL